MKRFFLPLILCLSLNAFAQPGYEIKVTVKPFKNQYVFLGHYFGKQYPIIDSAMLNDKSEGVFKGSTALPGGIYLIGYPNRSGFFEVLVDKSQHFSVIADTATMSKGVQFVNSPDNILFNTYQQDMTNLGKQLNIDQAQLKSATNTKDSAHWKDELAKDDKKIQAYRDGFVKTNPKNILTTFLLAMREPVLPDSLKSPKTKVDSTTAYHYFKDHYWDGVEWGDGRLAYTTFFEDKIDKYYNQLVPLEPDSVIKEIDYMLAFATPSEEMTRFLLLKFVNRYLSQRYMWEDAVFVHLFEKYFNQKNYTWLNDKGKKTITDRAYSLMANIMGTPASDIELPDTAGKKKKLYAVTAPFTVVVFFDPGCSHCKEILPKLDSFYQAKWKGEGLRVYAVAKETDATRNDWLNFIRDHKLQEWTNVYYSKAEDKARTDAGTPGYSQLYDVQTFPTLYLLDKDKRIIAKKLTYQQIEDVLALKLKGQ